MQHSDRALGKLHPRPPNLYFQRNGEKAVYLKLNEHPLLNAINLQVQIFSLSSSVIRQLNT